jgi:WD40 repeat protein
MNESSTVLATNLPILSLAISPDGKRIASGGHMVINNRDALKNIRMHNAESGELIFSIAGHGRNVNGVRFHPNGKLFATCSDDRLIKVWESDTGILVATLAGHFLGVTSIDFSNDGSQLVSCGRDGEIKLWDFSSQECIASWKFRPDQNTPVVTVKFSPSGRVIASGSQDGTVCVWDAASKIAKLDFRPHQSSVTGLCFLDESRLVSVSDDGSSRPLTIT